MSRRPPIPNRLQASGVPERVFRLTGSANVAAVGEDSKALRRFRMDAYNGGPMQFAWADVPVVVDLAGLDLTDKARPILKDHEAALVVGHSEAFVNSGSDLAVEGVVSGTGDAAREVVDNADRGFPWQASISVTMQKIERIAAGVSVEVNGRTIVGPCLIVRASRMSEVSFVALGADDSTEAHVLAAHLSFLLQGSATMDFPAWLKSLGFDPAALSTEQTAALQKAYDAEQAAAKAATDKAPDAPVQAAAARKALSAAMVEVGKLTAAAVKKPGAGVPDELQASRTAAAEETRRITGIRKLCASGHGDIEAKAIEEGWSLEKAELTVLRAGRSSAPNIGSSRTELTTDILQAAVLQAARIPNLERMCDVRVLEAAQARFRGQLGLQEFILEAAQANGYTGTSFMRDKLNVLRAAFGQLQAGGFSTVDTPGILSNIANKFLLDGFMSVDMAWKKIAAIRPVNDFKTITSYRLTGSTQYEKIGATGEIKSGTLAEESYTNKADTYGKLFAISRADLINDDMGALTKVPRLLGRGGALKLNDVFWTEWLADAGTFYTAGRKNYFVGAVASLLTIDGLTQAVQMFRDQVDADGKPLGINPSLLVVPTSLEVTALNLFNGQNLAVGALGATNAKSTEPNVNPHARKYEPVVCPYLNNATYPGFSSTAWWLAANPADVAVIEVAFLNGQESPTVETADADFSTLGIQMRGYHDFGVKKQDYRAAVKAKGAA